MLRRAGSVPFAGLTHSAAQVAAAHEHVVKAKAAAASGKAGPYVPKQIRDRPAGVAGSS